MSAYILRLGGFFFFLGSGLFCRLPRQQKKGQKGKKNGSPVLHVLASVRREGKGVRIGLPNGNFSAAAAVRADTSFGIIAGCSPALDICLAADELEIAGASSIAILCGVSPQFKLIEILVILHRSAHW
jgi:hypothetical protein